MKIKRMVTIQRIVMLLIVAILLAACGGESDKANSKADAVQENVDKTFAADTKRVLKELDDVVENEEPPSEKVIEITDRYLEVYSETEKTEEEENIFKHTRLLIITNDGTDYLESDKEGYRFVRDAVLNIIETGKHSGHSQ